MVIDVDAELCRDLLISSALNGVALEEDGAVGRRCGKIVNDAFDACEALKLLRNGVLKGDNDILPHSFEDVHEADRRPNGIAVRPGVGAYDEAVTVADYPQKG